jgi:hypothetical protein
MLFNGNTVICPFTNKRKAGKTVNNRYGKNSSLVTDRQKSIHREFKYGKGSESENGPQGIVYENVFEGKPAGADEGEAGG